MSAEFKDICTVPCRPVNDEVKVVEGDIKERVTWRIFALVVSGIGIGIGVLFGMINSNQAANARGQAAIVTTLSFIQADVKVQTVQIESIKQDIYQIKQDIRNGGRPAVHSTPP